MAPRYILILCVAAALTTSSGRGADPGRNPGGSAPVHWNWALWLEALTDHSVRATAREQRTRAAALRRIVARTGAGKIDAATGLTIGSPKRVEAAMGGDGRATSCYLAASIVPCWREDEALRQLCSPDFGDGQAVVEIGSGQALDAAPAGPGSRARVVVATPHEVVVRCSADGRELLVLRGTFLTRMDCAVDSVSQSPFRVNYVSYGVTVPPGEHEVRFTALLPRWWLPAVPVALALLGLGIAGGWLWRRRRAGGEVL